MIEIGWEQLLNTSPIKEKVTATIGVFDGFHLGHQAMLSQLKKEAGETPIMVVTFDPNPKKVLKPNEYAGDILPFTEKKKILSSLGVDILIVIDFSLNFSRISGEIFFLELLRHFWINKLIWGYDFSFGAGSTTTKTHIQQMSHKPEIIDVLPVLADSGVPISSTQIRKSILAGNIGIANKLLGYPYTLFPELTYLDKRSEWFIPLEKLTQVCPPEGIYLGEINGKTTNVTITKQDLRWSYELNKSDFYIKLIAKL